MTIESEVSSVPIIDLGLSGSGRATDPDQLASELERAMQISGFFYVRNHAISRDQLTSLVHETKAFFDLPLVERQAIAIDQNNRGYLGQGEARMSGATQTDLKEVFFFGRDLAPDDPDIVARVPLCALNQWPVGLPAFRPTVLRYLDAAAQTGTAIMRGFASMLGVSSDFFESRYERPMARGQLVHYPAPASDVPVDQFGVAPHTDFGCITLLYQHTPGLEVMARSGRWLRVPPIDGTLVVNIGDLLERWSNARLPSTRHRVRNETGNSRYSIAIFYDPSATTIVDPRDLRPGSAEFEPIAASDYILSRSQKVFKQFDQTIGEDQAG